jgi:hypothetical protein
VKRITARPEIKHFVMAITPKFEPPSVTVQCAQEYTQGGEDLKLPDGRDRVVRHGHGPHRAIQTESDLPVDLIGQVSPCASSRCPGVARPRASHSSAFARHFFWCHGSPTAITLRFGTSRGGIFVPIPPGGAGA